MFRRWGLGFAVAASFIPCLHSVDSNRSRHCDPTLSTPLWNFENQACFGRNKHSFMIVILEVSEKGCRYPLQWRGTTRTPCREPNISSLLPFASVFEGIFSPAEMTLIELRTSKKSHLHLPLLAATMACWVRRDLMALQPFQKLWNYWMKYDEINSKAPVSGSGGTGRELRSWSKRFDKSCSR